MRRKTVTAIALLVIGVGFGVAGIIAGLVPRYSGGVNCGAVFAPAEVSQSSLSSFVAQGYCNLAIQAAVPIVVWLFVLSGVALIAAAIVAVMKTRSQDPHPETVASEDSTPAQDVSHP